MRWQVASPPDAEMRARFPELDPIAVQLLWNRGLRTQEQVDEFLLPDYGQDVHDPFLLRDMRRACERIWTAFERREKIVVYSDYDADGVTGAAVLVSTLRAAAARFGLDGNALVASYIPHREKEGYGLRIPAVEELCSQGMKLLVTVDCGISSAAEIARAKELGVEAIVVDHHHVPEVLPDCLILHPGVPGENYPFKHLAAVGVAFKFACGLIRFAAEKGSPFETGFDKWLLDLVAIATVTDFMPLVGENRTLEKYGLVVLNKTRRPGLRKLIELAGLEPGRIDTVSVGYYIGPRINAASRMEHAATAFETVMAATDEEAAVLAARLDKLNSDRQRYTESIMVEANKLLVGAGDDLVQVLAGDGWSAGIVGLVAGKLADRAGRPAFVFGREGDRFVGSGRGIEGFDMMAGLERAKGYLARFGGHYGACGLTIEGEKNYQEFGRSIKDYAREVLAGRDLRPTLEIDAELAPSQANWELIGWLQKFEPFGEGNAQPRFLMRGLAITSVDTVGKSGQHLRLGARGDGARELKLIGFGMAADALPVVVPGARLDAVVEVSVNEWNGNKSIQLRLVDWCLAGSDKAAAADCAVPRGLDLEPSK
jgi:single-stranded-DNA-specific exonuclease